MINSNLRLISFVGFLFFIYSIFILIIGFIYNSLPPPLHNVPLDAFMDWVNVNIWASSVGKYTEWQSIYPPLTFVIANLLSTADCVAEQSLANKIVQCSRNTIIFFVGFFLLSMFLTYKFVSQSLKCEKFMKVGVLFFFWFSIPSIYLFERGNYLIVAYCLFLIMLIKNNIIYSILIRSILINLKPYFILLSFDYFFKRSFKEFFIIIIFSGIIFFITDIIINDSNSLLFINNSLSFTLKKELPFQGINYQMNFDLLIGALDAKFKLTYIKDLYLGVKFFSILLFLYFIIKNDYNSYDFMFISILLLMIMSYSFGGYLCIFLLPFIPHYIKDKVIIYMLILLMIPFDLIVYSRELGYYVTSIFTEGTFIRHSLNLSLLSGMRPLLVQILFFYIIYIRTVTLVNRKTIY